MSCMKNYSIREKKTQEIYKKYNLYKTRYNHNDDQKRKTATKNLSLHVYIAESKVDLASTIKSQLSFYFKINKGNKGFWINSPILNVIQTNKHDPNILLVSYYK